MKLVKQAINIYNLASLLVNTKLYIIRDKYKLKVFKKLAFTKYKEILPNIWNTFIFLKKAFYILNNMVKNN